MSHSFMGAAPPARELETKEKTLVAQLVPLLQEIYTDEDIEARLCELLVQLTVRG